MMLRPLTLKEANDFVAAFHRHNKPVVGHRFSIGLEFNGKLIGVAIVGRPVARMVNAQTHAEITRLCVNAGAPKGACSKLYRACSRAWAAMGGLRVITYTLKSESGASLRGAGARLVGEVKAAEWSRPSRKRTSQPVYTQPKLKWEIP